MVFSMTGYGRGEAARHWGRIRVELRSVNHRYLDLNMKMPKPLLGLEGGLRQYCKKSIGRGKVDVFVHMEHTVCGPGSSLCQKELAAVWLRSLRSLGEELGLRDDLALSHICGLPGVLDLGESREEEGDLESLLREAMDLAMEGFSKARSAEGAFLQRDLEEKLLGLEACLEQVNGLWPQAHALYQNRLRERMEEFLSKGDWLEERIAAEAALLAEKACIDEECVRLASHIEGMRVQLAKGGAVGRQLDFLAQEMHREANTILSKAGEARISALGIELKSRIEQIREQVQNLE